MMKRTVAFLVGIFLLACLVPADVCAAAPGVYTASVTTSYYNPDTGEIDDGGTANAALGEGMCRSATDTVGLVEVDRDGNVWITIRLLLQSSCSDIAFYTRTGNNSYSRVSYDITAENTAKDSIDYRFKASSEGVKLKATMYVTPMGRDVLWYLWVEPSTMSAGSGDFAVNIDLSEPEPAPQPEPEPQPEPTPEPAPEPQKEPDKPAVTAPEPQPEPEKPADAPAVTEPVPAPEPEQKEPEAADEPEDNGPEANEAESHDEPAPEPEGDEEDNTDDSAEPEAAAETDPAPEPEAERQGVGGVAVIVAALAVAAVGGGLMLKKRR